MRSQHHYSWVFPGGPKDGADGDVARLSEEDVLATERGASAGDGLWQSTITDGSRTWVMRVSLATQGVTMSAALVSAVSSGNSPTTIQPIVIVGSVRVGIGEATFKKSLEFGNCISRVSPHLRFNLLYAGTRQVSRSITNKSVIIIVQIKWDVGNVTVHPFRQAAISKCILSEILDLLLHV